MVGGISGEWVELGRVVVGKKIFTLHTLFISPFVHTRLLHCHLRLYHPLMPPTSKCNAPSRVRYRSTRKVHRAGGGSNSSRTTKHKQVSLQDVILLHKDRKKKKFVTQMTYYLKCMFTQHNTEKRKHMIRSLNKLNIKSGDTTVESIPVMYDPTQDDGAQFKALAEGIYEDKRFFVESRGTRLLSIWGPRVAMILFSFGTYCSLMNVILNGKLGKKPDNDTSSDRKREMYSVTSGYQEISDDGDKLHTSLSTKSNKWGNRINTFFTPVGMFFQMMLAAKLSLDMGDTAEYVIGKHTLPGWGKTGKKRFESLFT